MATLIFQCHIFLPFHTVHGVLQARILEWIVIYSSSGLHFDRTLHYDPSILSGPSRHGSQFHWTMQAPLPLQGYPWFRVNPKSNEWCPFIGMRIGEDMERHVEGRAMGWHRQKPEWEAANHGKQSGWQLPEVGREACSWQGHSPSISPFWTVQE